MASLKTNPVDLSSRRVTIIQKDVKLEGTLYSNDITYLFGLVTGRIIAGPNSLLIIGQGAAVKGDIFAEELVVHGHIEGNVAVTHRVMLSQTARIVGNCTAKRISIDFGAQIQGKCSTYLPLDH